MDTLNSYVPMDRRQALAGGTPLPDRAIGAALLVAISGLTPLTAALVQAFGPQRGADELSRTLNRLYEALTAEVDRYQGAVISVSGDALTCWFEGDQGAWAAACAVAMLQALASVVPPLAAGGSAGALALKVAVAAGPARRWLVGDPAHQCLEALAGATLDRLARAAHLAAPGELVLDPVAGRHLAAALPAGAWRTDPATAERYAVVTDPATFALDLPDPMPWPPPADLPAEQVRPWLLPAVYARLASGQDMFLAELRPTVALFLRFGGLDYDGDDGAGAKLDAYIRWVQEVLVRHAGALLSLTIGDQGSYLHAVFGVPFAQVDDPARAVAAALELIEPPPALAPIARLRIGIHGGPAWVGSYGGSTRTYGVLGDPVTLAARLMLAAAPGQILVSQALTPALPERFRFQALPPLALDGTGESVAVCAALSA